MSQNNEKIKEGCVVYIVDDKARDCRSGNLKKSVPETFRDTVIGLKKQALVLSFPFSNLYSLPTPTTLFWPYKCFISPSSLPSSDHVVVVS